MFWPGSSPSEFHKDSEYLIIFLDNTLVMAQTLKEIS